VDLKEAFNQYSTAELIDQTLSTIKGDKVKTVNKTLRDLADTQIPCFRELKGKPLNRVFWQVVSSNNISKINELVKESV
jgi:uncharacterized protein (UPF0248 family)